MVIKRVCYFFALILFSSCINSIEKEHASICEYFPNIDKYVITLYDKNFINDYLKSKLSFSTTALPENFIKNHFCKFTDFCVNGVNEKNSHLEYLPIGKISINEDFYLLIIGKRYLPIAPVEEIFAITFDKARNRSIDKLNIFFYWHKNKHISNFLVNADSCVLISSPFKTYKADKYNVLKINLTKEVYKVNNKGMFQLISEVERIGRKYEFDHGLRISENEFINGLWIDFPFNLHND